jgi:hypothetical protein
MPKMNDNSDMATRVESYFYKVFKEQLPPRVHMGRAIQVQRLSQIPNAGRGLLAREDIKEGELIFAVDPIIATVSLHSTAQTQWAFLISCGLKLSHYLNGC